MFKVELATIINPDLPLVLLAGQIDWNFFRHILSAHFYTASGIQTHLRQCHLGTSTFSMIDDLKKDAVPQITISWGGIRWAPQHDSDGALGRSVGGRATPTA